MNTLEKVSNRKEISDLNSQIKNLDVIMRDYKLMQAGDYTKSELEEEKEALILKRNKLLANTK